MSGMEWNDEWKQECINRGRNRTDQEVKENKVSGGCEQKEASKVTKEGKEWESTIG